MNEQKLGGSSWSVECWCHLRQPRGDSQHGQQHPSQCNAARDRPGTAAPAAWGSCQHGMKSFSLFVVQAGWCACALPVGWGRAAVWAGWVSLCRTCCSSLEGCAEIPVLTILVAAVALCCALPQPRTGWRECFSVCVWVRVLLLSGDIPAPPGHVPVPCSG